MKMLSELEPSEKTALWCLPFLCTIESAENFLILFVFRHFLSFAWFFSFSKRLREKTMKKLFFALRCDDDECLSTFNKKNRVNDEIKERSWWFLNRLRVQFGYLVAFIAFFVWQWREFYWLKSAIIRRVFWVLKNNGRSTQGNYWGLPIGYGRQQQTKKWKITLWRRFFSKI